MNEITDDLGSIGGVVSTDAQSITPSRDLVLRFEQALKAFSEENNCGLDADSLTSHYFAPGIYARELLIPAGTCLTGKIHRHAHLNIVAQGRISVLTEHGVKEIAAPAVIRSDAGIKRIGFALEDTVWICIHPREDDCEDLEKLEQRYIAPDFEALPHTEPDKCLGRQ